MRSHINNHGAGAKILRFELICVFGGPRRPGFLVEDLIDEGDKWDRRYSFQETDKSLLLKMTIRGQSLCYSPFPHNNKADGVAEGI